MKKARQKKRQGKKHIIFSILISMLIGAIIGFLTTKHVSSILNSGRGTMEIVISLILMLVELYAAIFLQIVIHEAGHLILGLLTGYRFLSFRIGNFMWVRENKRLKIKRLSLAGTGGQCLLLPPEPPDKKAPFALYHLGGAILNLVSSLIFFILYLFFQNVAYLSLFLLIVSLVGLAIALLNGIPMQYGLVSNDGQNVRLCAKDNKTLHAMCIQLKVVGELSRGIRLRDMPEEWFSFIALEEMNNGIVATIAVFAANRLLDSQLLDEADQLAARLLEVDSLEGIHRNLLVCDRIYYEVINKNRKDIVDMMRDNPQKEFMKSMKKFPSVLRTEYAYMLLVEKSMERAEKIMATFEKVARTYPYSCEIESERELMNIANRVSDGYEQ